VGEKGSARFALRAHGRPGHGSMPHPNNAVLKLADAINRLGATEMPHRVTPAAESFVRALAANVDARHRDDVLGLLDPQKFSGALTRLSLDGNGPMIYAMFHDTVVPTMLNAGTKINVIPSVAEARFDARVLPGQTSPQFLKQLRTVVDPEIEIDFLTDMPGFGFDFDTRLFHLTARVLSRHQPTMPVLPYMVVGATDARHVRKLGTRVYGFCPMMVAADDLEGVHAHNERISVENLGFGTRVLHEVVSEFCTNV
jgi:acetylornithine deacetylase/succinyl-diaminopimelate desuccinylase-like protein